MASDKSKTVKIIVIVVCLAGAAAGLWLAFGPSDPPRTTSSDEDLPAIPEPEPDPRLDNIRQDEPVIGGS